MNERRGTTPVDVGLSMSNMGGEFHMMVEKSNGDGTYTIVGVSQNSGLASESLTLSLSPGDYFLRVYKPDARQYGDYTLRLGFGDRALDAANAPDPTWVPLADDPRPGTTRATALTLAAGETTTRMGTVEETHVWKLNAPDTAGESHVLLGLSVDRLGHDIKLRLTDAYGNTVQGLSPDEPLTAQKSGPAAESLLAYVPDDRAYYLEVTKHLAAGQTTHDNRGGDYALRLGWGGSAAAAADPFTPGRAVDIEDRVAGSATRGGAADIGDGLTHINGGGETVNYWRLVVNADADGGRVPVGVSFDRHVTTNFRLTLEEAASPHTAVATSTVAAWGSPVLFTNVFPGTYRVRVDHATNGTLTAGYSLSVGTGSSAPFARSAFNPGRSALPDPPTPGGGGGTDEDPRGDYGGPFDVEVSTDEYPELPYGQSGGPAGRQTGSNAELVGDWVTPTGNNRAMRLIDGNVVQFGSLSNGVITHIDPQTGRIDYDISGLNYEEFDWVEVEVNVFKYSTNDTETKTVRFMVSDVNEAPRLTSWLGSGKISATDGVYAGITAQDVDDGDLWRFWDGIDDLSLHVSGLPNGLQIYGGGPNGWTLAGIPIGGSGQDHDVQIRVTDSGGEWDTVTVTYRPSPLDEQSIPTSERPASETQPEVWDFPETCTPEAERRAWLMLSEKAAEWDAEGLHAAATTLRRFLTTSPEALAIYGENHDVYDLFRKDLTSQTHLYPHYREAIARRLLQAHLETDASLFDQNGFDSLVSNHPLDSAIDTKWYWPAYDGTAEFDRDMLYTYGGMRLIVKLTSPARVYHTRTEIRYESDPVTGVPMKVQIPYYRVMFEAEVTALDNFIFRRDVLAELFREEYNAGIYLEEVCGYNRFTHPDSGKATGFETFAITDLSFDEEVSIGY